MFGHKVQKVNEFTYLVLRRMAEEKRKRKEESHTNIKSKEYMGMRAQNVRKYTG